MLWDGIWQEDQTEHSLMSSKMCRVHLNSALPDGNR